MAIIDADKINISGTLVRNRGGIDKIVDGKEVEGGYFVCETLPTWGTTGQLCYCTGTEANPINKFYQYNGTSSSWVVKDFGATCTTLAEKTDLNSITTGGLYFLKYDQGYQNLPDNFLSGWLEVKYFKSNYIIQTLTGLYGTSETHPPRELSRFWGGESWTAWELHIGLSDIENSTNSAIEAALDNLFVWDEATATLTISTEN